MFEQGSVVKISINLLFGDWTKLIQRLEYTVRPECYGVVKDFNEQHGYNVEWAICGMFDLGHDQRSVFFEEANLTLLRANGDSSYGQISYLINYFNWEWFVDKTPIICDNCLGEGDVLYLPKDFRIASCFLTLLIF